MKKAYIYLIYILIMIVIITGCGHKNPSQDSETSVAENIEEEDNFDRTGLTWDNTKWMKPEAVDSGKKLYIESYQNHQWIYSEGEKIGTVKCGNIYYRLVKTGKESECDYIIECYDLEKGTSLEILLDKDILFEEDEDSQLIDFCVEKENTFVLLLETVKDAKMTGLSAVYANKEGKKEKRVELYEAFVESGIRPVTDIDWWGTMGVYVGILDDNNYLMTVYGRTPIAVIDRKGTLIEVITTAKSESDLECGYYSINSMKTVDGNTVFWCTEGKESTLFTYNKDKGVHQLIKFDSFSEHSSCVLSEDGYCYLINGSKLYRWDIFTGKSIVLFDIAESGISENGSKVRLSLNDTGCPILYYDRGEYLEIYELTYEKPDTDKYLTVVSFSGTCKELEATCAEYTRMHPTDGIWVEKPKDDLEAYRTRMVAEMTEGKGPDAMYVTPADFQILYEKGLLEDMTGYLSPELEKEIFKGVLDCGKIDGKQMGYPLAAKLSTMLVDESLWDEENWSLQDIMNIINSGQMPNLKEAVLLEPSTWKWAQLSAGVLQAFALEDLNNTPFLNLEQGTCNFDSPEFIQLLELCKKYPKTLSGDWDIAREVEQGSMLAYVGNVTSLREFSYTMYDAGETLKCVGFPTQDGYGSYWDYNYLLVVRKGSGKKETVRKLMESLYGMNNQRKIDNPVNRTVFEQCIKPSAGLEDYAVIDVGDQSGIMIKTKRDGSTWVSEYLDLADKAVPQPHDADMPAQIVREEVTAYFNGSKDAASVAKIIQNRVKLWMMEQI